MTVLLPQTATAIADCRKHIDKQDDPDPAIVSYLTRYLTLAMCAEIEAVVTRIIRERIGQGCDDSAAANFLKSLDQSSVRNAKYSEITSVIKRFGSDYEKRFKESVTIEVGERGISRLGLVVWNRNAIAHKSPPDITFHELETTYAVAEDVVAIVEAVLKR